MFTRQSFPIPNYSINLISFFCRFPRILIGRKIKAFKALLPMRKSICYLFLRPKKDLNLGKRTHQKVVIMNVFFLRYNREEPFCPHTQFPLTDQIVVETDFILCEACKSMTFHIHNKRIEVKRNRHCSIMMNWNEKCNIVDRVWIETSIESVKK